MKFKDPSDPLHQEHCVLKSLSDVNGDQNCQVMAQIIGAQIIISREESLRLSLARTKGLSARKYGREPRAARLGGGINGSLDWLQLSISFCFFFFF